MANNLKLNRKECVQLFGLGAACWLASACLGGCSAAAGNDGTPVPTATGVNTALDLAAATSALLNTASVGCAYADSRAIVVAKTLAGTCGTFQAPCPRQGTSVYFRQARGHFICSHRNAIFNLSGGVLSGPAPSGLRQCTVVQNGNALTISG